MRKEILLAIFVGITLGLMITFGIYQNRENSQANQNTTSNELINNPLSSDSATSQNSQLAIISPESNLLTDQETLMVSGTTNANSLVVIFVNGQDQVTSSDQTGNFSKEIELQEGANLLEIYAIDEDNQSIRVEKSVVYDPDYLNPDAADSAAATTSAKES